MFTATTCQVPKHEVLLLGQNEEQQVFKEGVTMVLGVAAPRLKRFHVAGISKLKIVSFCKEVNLSPDENFQSPWHWIGCDGNSHEVLWEFWHSIMNFMFMTALPMQCLHSAAVLADSIMDLPLAARSSGDKHSPSCLASLRSVCALSCSRQGGDCDTWCCAAVRSTNAGTQYPCDSIKTSVN